MTNYDTLKSVPRFVGFYWHDPFSWQFLIGGPIPERLLYWPEIHRARIDIYDYWILAFLRYAIVGFTRVL